ncbi:MAG: tryptophanase, partial [Bacteroidota bacterium]
MAFKTIIEPFKIKSVEPIMMSTEEQRIGFLKTANYNPFMLRSEQVIIDFLTDSGTSAMSAKQWAGIMDGDESYAGSRSWFRMESIIKDLTGMEFILPTHQGRAAERILYGHLGGKGKVFFSNTLFDTSRANIEFSGAEGIDLSIEESELVNHTYPFKGNIDTVKLEEKIKNHDLKNIAGVVLTVTNNSGGGQPVSMQNVKETSRICKQYGILLFIDCCRIAENAWFIVDREHGYANKTYKEVAQEIFSYADGALM